MDDKDHCFYKVSQFVGAGSFADTSYAVLPHRAAVLMRPQLPPTHSQSQPQPPPQHSISSSPFSSYPYPYPSLYSFPTPVFHQQCGPPTPGPPLTPASHSAVEPPPILPSCRWPPLTPPQPQHPHLSALHPNLLSTGLGKQQALFCTPTQTDLSLHFVVLVCQLEYNTLVLLCHAPASVYPTAPPP